MSTESTMKKILEQCYMCDALETSREHVPPKCIFPERKDTAGTDYRAGLITVPSCDAHNMRKSKDDEFLMVSIAGIIGNNSLGFRHKFTKVDRAIRRSSGRLLNSALKNQRRTAVQIRDNAFIEVIWGTPDLKRLESCFSHIALGLFFHHFGRRFNGRLKTLLGHLHHTEANPATFAQFVKHKAAMDLEGKPKTGSNPEAFFYQFSDPDQFSLRLLRMCFYGGIDIYTAFIPDGVSLPTNFALKMIEGGIKTYINLGDTTYEFN